MAPVGTGRRDSLAPIVRIDDRLISVDLGRPRVREAQRGAPELVRAVEGALALDGRGLALLVAPPILRRAYPREHMVTIGLGDDVLYQQLLDLLRVLIGGPTRSFDGAAAPPATIAPRALSGAAKRHGRHDGPALLGGLDRGVGLPTVA